MIFFQNTFYFTHQLNQQNFNKLAIYQKSVNRNNRLKFIQISKFSLKLTVFRIFSCKKGIQLSIPLIIYLAQGTNKFLTNLRKMKLFFREFRAKINSFEILKLKQLILQQNLPLQIYIFFKYLSQNITHQPMINFASLFGSFNRGGSSAINDLVEKPETNLDQLLDIESFLNQYKSGNNSKIQDYMKYDKYRELVNYVTIQGPANNQKKGYKFPLVAADILSTQNSVAIDYFLPDGQVEIEVQYDSTEQVEVEIQDDQDSTQIQSKTQNTTEPSDQIQPSNTEQTQEKRQIQNESSESPKSKKTKKVKETRPVRKTRKQQKQALIGHLLNYFDGPINYTLAGYTCKVLTILFTKKPIQFINFIANSEKNYIELISKHVESKSVGDFITKLLVYQSAEFVDYRKKFYNHLVYLMSTLTQAHVISNLAYSIHEIIEKTSVYIKTKTNISNNPDIIQAFMEIFFRTDEVHKIINNAMSDNENKSGYNCHVLHGYLHYTQIETFNSFKLQEVLQTFITKATNKLRDIPNRKTLGMGRVKIVEIFCFLIRKPRKTVEQDNKQNQLSTQLLQELYLHDMISKVNDFFTILFKLVQSFENNNILHNQVFRIVEAVLKQPQQNNSSLQQLLLNDENNLLKFILVQAQKDKQLKTADRPTRRKGYIGHVVNLCRLIQKIQNNDLLNQRIQSNSQFQLVLNSVVAFDVNQTSKNLAGYEMKKNPIHTIMFQKQDILTAYADFLNQCPKPVFEPQPEPQQDHIESPAYKQLQAQQQDQQKFNEVAAVAQQIDSNNPKYWIHHIPYDIDSLIHDVQ